LSEKMAAARIDILLRLAADNPDSVLQSLAAQVPSEPDFASSHDAHGYTLLHAASSYGHVQLMKELVQTYKVDPNILDDDGDTPLFYAESLDVVRGLIEELGADPKHRNEEGLTAEDKIREEGEGEWVAGVLDYLAIKIHGNVSTANGTTETPSLISRPGMVPENVEVEFGTMQELPEQEADPEFRRRIEELASRGDLNDEEMQAELRVLVTDVVSGLHDNGTPEAQRRRLDE